MDGDGEVRISTCCADISGRRADYRYIAVGHA